MNIKRRSGDENIGKLIIFAVTIVIAIGLVTLVTYFYNKSRETAINTSVLSDQNSSFGAILDIPALTTACATNPKIEYNPISGVYTMTGTLTNATDCYTALGTLKGVTIVGTGTYKIQ